MTDPVKYLIPESLYTPHRPAVLCGNQIFSYAQLFDTVSSTKTHLKRLGIQPEDRVGILSPNSPNYLIVLLALWQMRAVACPLSTRLSKNILNEQLQSIKCRFFLRSSEIPNGIDISHINLNEIVSIRTDIKEGERNNFQYLLKQEATILFTSGSACEPKAVLHTFGNHYYSAKGSNEHIPVVPGDQWLLSLPLYHVGGLSIIFRTFLGGGRIVVPEGEETIEHILTKHKITHISLVPTQLIRLLRNKGCHSQLKKLKVILLGGSAIPDSVIQEAQKLNLSIYTTYGLTEMSSQVATSNRLTEEDCNRSAKILNHRRLMISEDNEILVKGEVLFKGYIEDAELSLPFNINGYFATGDMGHFSGDGNLIVTGRKDNMFVSGGENIQPEEIEKYLCQLEGVEQAVVVPITSGEFGFRPIAFIKAEDNLNRNNISTFLKDCLPSFKIPECFYAWPEQEEAGNLKISRRDLARLVEEQSPSLTSIE